MSKVLRDLYSNIHRLGAEKILHHEFESQSNMWDCPKFQRRRLVVAAMLRRSSLRLQWIKAVLSPFRKEFGLVLEGDIATARSYVTIYYVDNVDTVATKLDTVIQSSPPLEPLLFDCLFIDFDASCLVLGSTVLNRGIITLRAQCEETLLFTTVCTSNLKTQELKIATIRRVPAEKERREAFLQTIAVINSEIQRCWAVVFVDQLVVGTLHSLEHA